MNYPFFHAIEVRYLPATNTKGARVKLLFRDGTNVILNRDYSTDASKQAIAYIESKGYEIVGVTDKHIITLL